MRTLAFGEKIEDEKEDEEEEEKDGSILPGFVIAFFESIQPQNGSGLAGISPHELHSLIH